MLPKYLLLDSNVTAAYYLSSSTKSKKVRTRIESIFDSKRSGKSDFFFYLPNFCVAEVFSVFMKYSFSAWNRHVTKTIDTRVYKSLVEQFQKDIHNGKFIYHYELSRYHVLAINLVAPIDHYYQYWRGKKPVNPMGTFDHLIISMGIHLAHIHGRDNVAIVSADQRLTDILSRCNAGIPRKTIQKLKIDSGEKITGRNFCPETFPHFVNLRSARKRELIALFGQWPLPVGKLPRVYRA